MTTTFKNLISEYGEVVIPRIQRDYAQGREKDVREPFVEALVEQLLTTQSQTSDSISLDLDFVYGNIVENPPRRAFLPLDGQQRLTTLMLLHWYLAWQDGELVDFRDWIMRPTNEEQIEGVCRFNYDVRPSSVDFFQALCEWNPDKSPSEIGNLPKNITNQPWYFRFWKLDPTIVAATSMLQSIHGKLSASKGLYKILTRPEQPPITFQCLELKGLKLSDDLYIKMNARGKPLTVFETFKARFEKIVSEEDSTKVFPISRPTLSIAEYFSKNIDDKWAGYFWRKTRVQERGSEMGYDAKLMNVIRGIALACRETSESDSFDQAFRALRDTKIDPHKIGFLELKNHGFLTLDFAKNLNYFLDFLVDHEATLSDDNQTGNPVFILAEKLRVRFLEQGQRTDFEEIIQLRGLLLLITSQTDLESEAAQEWIRLLLNLTRNTVYNRPAEVRNSYETLTSFSRSLGAPLKAIAETGSDLKGFYAKQIREEQLKAQLIMASSEWRSELILAEEHGYFRGQIDFLLTFSGTMEKWLAANRSVEDWSAEYLSSQLSEFRRHREKAFCMFGPNGLNELPNQLWRRAILTFGEYFLTASTLSSLLIDEPSSNFSWKRLLRGSNLNGPEIETEKSRSVLGHFFQSVNFVTSSPETALLEAIESGSVQNQLHRYLVEDPHYIDYCEQKHVLLDAPACLVLLKRKRRSAEHCDLLSLALVREWKSEVEEKFPPLQLQEYRPAQSGKWDPPSILFHHESSGQKLEIWWFRWPEESSYVLQVSLAEDSPKKEITQGTQDWLLQNGFNRDENSHQSFTKETTSQPEKALTQLAAHLPS